jgi:hypothetical protein
VSDGYPLNPPLLHINPHGLQNVQSLRGIIDGNVYFGADKFNIEKGKEVPLNDYVFNLEDPAEQIENTFGSRHFAI